MATYMELKGPALDAYKALTRDQLALASRELGADNLTRRSLRPQDISSSQTSWKFSPTFTSTTGDLVTSAQLSTDRWVGIYGIAYGQSTPLFSDVTITGKGQTLRIWNIEDIPSFQSNTGYFDDPLILLPNTTVTITVRNTTTSTSTSEELVFIGQTVERKGLVTAN